MTTRPDKSIHFGCPRCTAPLVVSAAQIGRMLPCPRCHATVHVPAESRKQCAEAYPVAAEDGPQEPLPPPEIVFHCPVCQTRLTAPEDRVGQNVPCPDCGTPAIVPPRPEQKPVKKLASQEGYDVHDDVARASAPVGPEYFAVYCGLCNTLMHATEDQVGTQLVCPDCGTSTTVHPPRLQRRAPKGFGDNVGEGYAVSAEREPPRPEPQWLAFHPSRGYESVANGPTVSDAADPLPPLRPHLPRWPLWSGVFGFPWHCGSRLRWFQMSLCACLIGFAGDLAITMANVNASGLAGLGPALLGLLATATATCAAAAWIAVAAIDGLTIVTETSAGSDSIADWPNPSLFVDWLGEAFFVVNSLGLSASAGLGLTWVLKLLDLANWYAMPLTLLVLFPFVLMSMLELNSAVLPFSPAIASSLIRRPLAWALFFGETVLVMGSASGIVTLARIGMGLRPAIPVVAAVLTAALMIYFRLVGRLAWCCSMAKASRGEPKGPDVAEG